MRNLFTSSAFTPLGSYIFEQDQEETMETSCAWCNQEQGIPQGEGTHGICQRHNDAMLASAAQGREARRNRRNR